jgi:hypothetical protein
MSLSNICVENVYFVPIKHLPCAFQVPLVISRMDPAVNGSNPNITLPGQEFAKFHLKTTRAPIVHPGHMLLLKATNRDGLFPSKSKPCGLPALPTAENPL